MYSNLISPCARQHMLFFIIEGSANCFGTVHVMFVVPILFIFFVVFECISSNIVKRDMALSSDEV